MGLNPVWCISHVTAFALCLLVSTPLHDVVVCPPLCARRRCPLVCQEKMLHELDRERANVAAREQQIAALNHEMATAQALE